MPFFCRSAWSLSPCLIVLASPVASLLQRLTRGRLHPDVAGRAFDLLRTVVGPPCRALVAATSLRALSLVRHAQSLL